MSDDVDRLYTKWICPHCKQEVNSDISLINFYAGMHLAEHAPKKGHFIIAKNKEERRVWKNEPL